MRAGIAGGAAHSASVPRCQGAIHPQHAGRLPNIAGNIRVDGTHAGMNRLATRRQIFQSKFDRTAARHFRKLIDLGFSGKRDLCAAQSS